MVAVFAAALALAGAPAGSTIECNPGIVQTVGALGLSSADHHAWVGVDSCAAALTAGMTARQYAATGHLSLVVIGWRTGRGLLVLLHESRHLAGVADECEAEKFAFAHVGELIDRFVPRSDRSIATLSAALLHSQLPPPYKGC